MLIFLSGNRYVAQPMVHMAAATGAGICTMLVSLSINPESYQLTLLSTFQGVSGSLTLLGARIMRRG